MRFSFSLTAVLMVLLSSQEAGSQPLGSSNASSPHEATSDVRKQSNNGFDADATSSNSRLLSSNMSWVEEASFPNLAENGAGWERLSLSADGSFLAARNTYGSEELGMVRFFETQESDGTWNERTDLRLFANSTEDIFGSDGLTAVEFFGSGVSLSKDGKRVAIGAIRENCSDDDDCSGSVCVYEMDSNGEWSVMGEVIHGEGQFGRLGWSVCLSKDGSIVASGTPFGDGNGAGSGHVRVYQWDGSFFNQLGEDIDGEAAGDGSGVSVALSSDGLVVAVGAPTNADGAGHVRVFSWDENEKRWSQRGSDIDGDAADDLLGWSVDLSGDGDILAVGARRTTVIGYAKVFQWKDDDGEWEQIGHNVESPDGNRYFGMSVSLSSSGLILAVGSIVYALVDNQWEGLAGAIGYIPCSPVSLSSDGTTIAVGCSGSVDVYNLVDDTTESTFGPSPISEPSSTSGPTSGPTFKPPPASRPSLGPTFAPSPTDSSGAGDPYSVTCPWHTMLFVFIYMF